MPLYSDMYHSYLGNMPTSSTFTYTPLSIASSVPSYSLSSYTPNYTSPYISPSIRSGGAGVSRYMPKLTTISESPLHKHRLAALTRLKSPSTSTPIVRRQSPKYVPPKPRRMDTSDIDVSTSSRFAHKKYEEEIDNKDIKENEDEFPSKVRSTIRRDRGLVRLRTIRMPEKEEKRKSEEKIDVDPGYGSSERSSGSWRKNLEIYDKPLSPTTKTLGESFIEKYFIKEREKSPEVKILFTLDDVPPERRESVRRRSSGLLPTFKEICSDISSDKLTDDLNAGELRRRASLIIEEEIKLINSDAACGESQGSDEEHEKKRKVKKIKQRVKSSENLEQATDLKEDKNTTVAVRKKKKLTDAEAMKNTCDSSMSTTPLTTVSAETNAPPESLINMKAKHTADPNKKLLIDKNATTAPGELPQIKKTQKNLFKTKSSVKAEANISEVPKMIPLRKDPSADDFWGMIGSRETTMFTKRKQRVIEDQQQKIFEVAWTEECEIFEEKNEKLSQILEKKKLSENDEKLKAVEISKIEPVSKFPKKIQTKEVDKVKSETIIKKEVDNLNKVPTSPQIKDVEKIDELKKDIKIDIKLKEEILNVDLVIKLPKKVVPKEVEKIKSEESLKKEIDKVKSDEPLKKEMEKDKIKTTDENINKLNDKIQVKVAEKIKIDEPLKKEGEKVKIDIKEDLNKLNTSTIKIKEAEKNKSEEPLIKKEAEKVKIDKDEKSIEKPKANGNLNKLNTKIQVKEPEKIKSEEPLNKKEAEKVKTEKPNNILNKQPVLKFPKKIQVKEVDKPKLESSIIKKEVEEVKIDKPKAQSPTIKKEEEKLKVDKPKIEPSIIKKEENKIKEDKPKVLQPSIIKKEEEKVQQNKSEDIKTSANKSNVDLPKTKVEELKVTEEKIITPLIEPLKKEKILPSKELKITKDEPATQKIEVKPAEQKIEKTQDKPKIIEKFEIKPAQDKTIEQKPATKRLFGKNNAKAPVEKDPPVMETPIVNEKHSLNKAIECKTEIEEMKTSKVLNETTQSRKKHLGSLAKFPTLNNLNSIVMNDATTTTTIDDNRELSGDTITVAADKSIENEKLANEQISIAKELSEATSNNQNKESALESESEESSYEEESSEEEEDMGKKDFDPQRKVKIDFTKMQKLFSSDEKSNIKLVARPRPLWKIKRNRHAKFSSESESSDEEVEETVGGSNDSVTSGSQSSANSDKVNKTTTTTTTNVLLKARVKSGSDAQNENIVALMQMLNVNENDNDDEAKKKSRFSTSSQDSGYSGMSGATAARSPRKALEKLEADASRNSRESLTPPCLKAAYRIGHDNEEDSDTSYTYAQFQKTGKFTTPATVIPRFRKYSVDDFHFLTVLGKGSFGKVFLAELKNTEYYYAIKCLKKDVVLEDDDVECTLIERKVLALGTKHPYLCHLFCTFQTDSHLFFVMEYLTGGDLMFHIQQSGRFTEKRARFYGAEIVSGLKFLHRKGIIYRDLKLDNVLLDHDGHVRIADFGMCKLEIYLDKTADSFCGTPDYMSPEIIKGEIFNNLQGLHYNQSVDWWSFGVLLYEMLIGQSPFSGCDEDELFWSICNEIPWYPHYLSKEALKILQSLLEKDVTIRLGSMGAPDGDIKYHPFFAEINWEKLDRRELQPPFKPVVRHPLDTQYFDSQFTRERARLTPIDKNILISMDQKQFEGFSYTNPNATLTKLKKKKQPKRPKFYFCPCCGEMKITETLY